MNRFFKIYLLLAASLATLLTSCVADDPSSGGDAASGAFTISTRALSSPTSTRATVTGYGETDALRPQERINNYSIIFIKKESKSSNSGVIQEIIQGTVTADNVNKDEKYAFTPTKLTGTSYYDIVALANVHLDSINELLKYGYLTGGQEPTDVAIPENHVQLKQDEKISDISVLLNSISNYSSLCPEMKESTGNTFSASKYMPMSGYRQDVSITENKEETYNNDGHGRNRIEVIRMFAKVEIMIKNSTDKSLKIQSVKFSKLNNCDLKLFPNYGILGEKMSSDKMSDFEKYLGGDYIVDGMMDWHPGGDNWATLTAGETKKAIFYTQDSSARLAHEFGRFMVTVEIEIGEGDDKKTIIHYAPTEELGWIQRNDHVVIPIALTDLVVDWAVTFYPPIGGYPAIVETDDDFNFRCIFGTQGEFAIRPIIRNADGKTIDGATFTVTDSHGNDGSNGKELKPKPKTEDSPSIFTKYPRRSGNEFVGRLNTNEGTDVFPLTVNVTYKDATGKEKTEIRSRNIYITRNNNLKQ